MPGTWKATCWWLPDQEAGRPVSSCTGGAYELRRTPTQRYKVLVLTFTNEAARELQSRLVREIPRRASGRVWCGNFHRLGQYLLRHYGHLIGIPRNFEVIDEVQSAEFLERVLGELGIPRVDPQELVFTVSRFRNPGECADELGSRPSE